jgi:hypothetical protein
MANNIAIETLIEKSLGELSNIGEENNIRQGAGSRLIFPKIRKGERRISEQELRFLLARELEKQKEFYYSVETPTEDEYAFTGENLLSARIDLCLHDLKGKRICLIELKYGNVDVTNDFLKLLCDSETEQNYFVQIVDNTDSGTVKSIEKKHKEALAFIPVAKIKSGVKIFLFVIREKALYECEISKDGILGKFNKSKKEFV